MNLCLKGSQEGEGKKRALVDAKNESGGSGAGRGEGGGWLDVSLFRKADKQAGAAKQERNEELAEQVWWTLQRKRVASPPLRDCANGKKQQQNPIKRVTYCDSQSGLQIKSFLQFSQSGFNKELNVGLQRHT